jgi:hypothetical protein
MAESPERMGRFRRIDDVADDDVVADEEDVAKERPAGTKAYNGIIMVREFKWESLSANQ